MSNDTASTTERQRRAKGSGGVYQRASDGLWVGAVSVTPARGEKRRKLTFTSKDRDVAQAKLDAWLAENRPAAPDPDAPMWYPMARKHSLAKARAIARHTEKEWRDKRRAANGVCFYCRRDVGPTGGQPDHVVPLGRGGSDGIDNLELACPDCNSAKATTPAPEFIEWAKRTGFFKAPPTTRGEEVSNQLDLDAIEARTKAASKGPWKFDRKYSPGDDGARTVEMVRSPHGCLWYPNSHVGINDTADGEFIAHARQDVPALLARVRELEALLDDAGVSR